jgi:hypothetical protein
VTPKLKCLFSNASKTDICYRVVDNEAIIYDENSIKKKDKVTFFYDEKEYEGEYEGEVVIYAGNIKIKLNYNLFGKK